MYSLKGVFPAAKKEPKRNFIKENMRQAKPVDCIRDQARTAPEADISKPKKSVSGIKFKKGDMMEFLKRKEMRNSKNKVETTDYQPKPRITNRVCDAGSQTEEGESGSLHEACGDRCKNKSPSFLRRLDHMRCGDILNTTKPRVDSKDPFVPSTYQKGVVPKYLRERRQEGEPPVLSNSHNNIAVCPPGHVELPETERKDTLKMLRSSFAELISELNKMPVRSDTLRMRNRKIELEKQLAKLEDGIKVFTQPKVFVKIGE